MFGFEELPKVNCQADGVYHAEHESPDHKAQAYGWEFEGGKTVRPVAGRFVGRLAFAHGLDRVTFTPGDEDTAAKVIAHRLSVDPGDKRIKAVRALFKPAAPAEVSTPVAAPEPVPPAPDSGAATPSQPQHKGKHNR